MNNKFKISNKKIWIDLNTMFRKKSQSTFLYRLWLEISSYPTHMAMLLTFQSNIYDLK